MINKIILGNALNILKTLPAESVNCCVTSPPYWSLRDYGVDPVIWDGDKNCKHIWKKEITKRPNASGGKTDWAKEKLSIKGVENYQEFVDYHKRETTSDFCLKCGAWKGNLGLEPTFELYIKHLCDIFDEVKRVLRKDGTCWVNMGDSYAGSGKAGSNPEYQNRHTEFGKPSTHHERFGMPTNKINYPNKSLCLIPQRFVIEMVNRGWIAHNVIIWNKPNCMPSSAKKRFTVDFEPVFFFSKSNKTLFWTNEKTLECINKKPSGTKGIENKDWEWRPCPKCLGTGLNQKWKVKDKDLVKIKDLHGECEKQGKRIHLGLRTKIPEKQKEICPRCKGLKKVKYSLWPGHDYWFEQQFEGYAPDTLPRMERGVNVNKWTFGADGQTPHNLSQPRLRKKRGYKIKQNDPKQIHPKYHGKDIDYNKYGRNKRCVWKIPTKSFKAAHFATFPETLIEPIIKAGCPEFICKKCGKARVKIYENHRQETRPGNYSKYTDNCYVNSKRPEGLKKRIINNPIEIGYSDCGCNAGFESGIVCDPFMGAGTSALVALKQRKRFIGIEIKQEYIDMSKRRIKIVQPDLF